MYKLIALYRQPADVAAFEQHYAKVHTPLIRVLPGLQALIINRGITPPWGGESPYYLLAEMHFADETSFRIAMASSENRAAGKDLRTFAGDIVTMLVVKAE